MKSEQTKVATTDANRVRKIVSVQAPPAVA